MRVCRYCGLTAHTSADLDLFAQDKSLPYGRKTICKTCSAVVQKQFRVINKDKTRVSRRNKRKDAKLEMLSYKGNKCSTCNIEVTSNNACIFDFHHIDPKQKEYKPASLMLMSWNKVIIELNKCILLCSNCHRMEHKRIRDES